MLRDLGSQFPPEQFPQLVVGLNAPDDAAVYVLDEQHALVQTLDFFAPVVDDPYEYGAIAAANAMSDVYAMGGSVLFALNIAAFPEDLPTEIAARSCAAARTRSERRGRPSPEATPSSMRSRSSVSR